MKKSTWLRTVLMLLLTLSLLLSSACAAPKGSATELESLFDTPKDAEIIIRHPFESIVEMVRGRVKAIDKAKNWTDQISVVLEDGSRYTVSFGLDQEKHFAITADLGKIGQYGLKLGKEQLYIKAGAAVFCIAYTEILPVVSTLISYSPPATEIVQDTLTSLPGMIWNFLRKDSGFTIAEDEDSLSVDFSGTQDDLLQKAAQAAEDWLEHYGDVSTAETERLLREAVQNEKKRSHINHLGDFHFSLDKGSDGKSWSLSGGFDHLSAAVRCTDGIISGRLVLPRDSRDYDISGKVIGDTLQLSLGIINDEVTRNGSNQILANVSLSWGMVKRLSVHLPQSQSLFTLSLSDRDGCFEADCTLNGITLLNARLNYTWDAKARTLEIRPNLYSEAFYRYGEIRVTADSITLPLGGVKYTLNVLENSENRWAVSLLTNSSAIGNMELFTPNTESLSILVNRVEGLYAKNYVKVLEGHETFEKAAFDSFETDSAIAVTAETLDSLFSLFLK